MMYNNGMGFGFGGGSMWFFGILIIVAIFFLFKAMSADNNGSNNNASTESPLDVLKKRYALGEIDEEEFERRKKTLDQ